jgi:hypothetical protein
MRNTHPLCIPVQGHLNSSSLLIPSLSLKHLVTGILHVTISWRGIVRAQITAPLQPTAGVIDKATNVYYLKEQVPLLSFHI